MVGVTMPDGGVPALDGMLGAPPLTPGIIVLFPAPTVIEAPGDCCLGVPLWFTPFTTLMFGPIMVPALELTPELTALPVCACALAKLRQTIAANNQRDIAASCS
jgi:hypothetical protein